MTFDEWVVDWYNEQREKELDKMEALKAILNKWSAMTITLEDAEKELRECLGLVAHKGDTIVIESKKVMNARMRENITHDLAKMKDFGVHVIVVDGQMGVREIIHEEIV